jgi:hypothetical protein
MKQKIQTTDEPLFRNNIFALLKHKTVNFRWTANFCGTRNPIQFFHFIRHNSCITNEISIADVYNTTQLNTCGVLPSGSVIFYTLHLPRLFNIIIQVAVMMITLNVPYVPSMQWFWKYILLHLLHSSRNYSLKCATPKIGIVIFNTLFLNNFR